MPISKRTAPSNSEDKLEELQRRYQLLDSEKRSNVETSSAQIRQHRETIRKLNDDNNRLRSEIGSAADSRNRASSLASAEDDAIRLKTKLNALKSDNMRKECLLEQLKAQLAVSDIARAVGSGESAADRKIRVVENRIDKAMIKYNEAQSIRKTYEGILHRLKEERIGFDRELRELELQLIAKRKDYDDLLLLSHDAMHAKEMAQAELHRFEQAVMEERNQRDREVTEKKLLVQQRVEMNQRLERSPVPPPVAPSAPPAPTGSPEQHVVGRENQRRQSIDEAGKLQQKLSDYEEAYSKLREVTGVSDVNEIIQKFISQDLTHKNLVKLTAEQQSRLDILHAEQGKLTLQLNELKFSGAAGSTAGSVAKKHALEDDGGGSDSVVAESAVKLEKAQSRYEKLAAMLVDVNAGIGHLHEKLSVVKLDGKSREDSAIALSEDTVEEVLNVCELKIAKLIDLTNQVSRGEYGPPPAPNRAPADIRVKILADSANDQPDFDPTNASPTNGHETEATFNRELFKQNSEIFVEKFKRYSPTPSFPKHPLLPRKQQGGAGTATTNKTKLTLKRCEPFMRGPYSTCKIVEKKLTTTLNFFAILSPPTTSAGRRIRSVSSSSFWT